MTESYRIKKIIVEDFNNLKSYIIENFIFFFDIVLFLLMCNYINYTGINKINFVDLMLPLLIRSTYSFVLYKYDKQDGINKSDNINNSIIIQIIAFGMYLSFMFSHTINDKGIINGVVGSFIFCFTILVMCIFLIKTIYFFLKGLKKDKINELNKYLNIPLLLSFSFFISSDNFNDIKNYIFSSTINNDTMQNIKDFNIYVTISFIFLVTYIRKENDMIFSYGKKINSMIVFATFIFITIHLYDNIGKDTIDYGLLSYLIIVMILSILVINFVIEYDISSKKKIFFISFKIFFIFYTSVKSFDIFPNFLMEIILLSIISTIGFKNSPLSINTIKIVKGIACIVGLCLLYTISKNYINDIKGNQSEYMGMVLCIISSLCLPAKNHEKNKDFKTTIKLVIKFFGFDHIHESIKIKKERVKHKGYLNVKEKIMLGFFILPIFLIIVHYIIVLMSKGFVFVLYLVPDVTGFIIYVIHVNQLTSVLFNLLGNIFFQLFLMVLIIITLLLVMRIFFTNERVLLVSPLHFEYAEYNYYELNITYEDNKCYLNFNNNKLYDIKNEEIEKYLKKKIKESLMNRDIV